MNNKKNTMKNSRAEFWSRTLRLVAIASVFFAPMVQAMQEMTDSALAETAGQGLLVADKLQGVANSNHTFYRMMLNAELGMNTSIDKLQLGCGGFNDAVVPGACDIDIDYVTMMGSGAGQPGAPGAGAAATSQFKLIRPYLELAVKNDGDPSRREIIGFKFGAAQADGYMGIGRYIAPGTAGTSCTAAKEGAGAFYCHQGINRLSGYMLNRMSGDAYGCTNIFGCTPNSNPDQQDHVATFAGTLVLWGTRINRIQTSLPAVADLLGINADSYVNQSLRFIHGMVIDPNDSEFAKDDFFTSFQREPVRYPTYNKTQSHSNTANPGWWMNIPASTLSGLKAYNVVVSFGALSGVTLADPDIGQRPPDNCFGALRFC